MPQNLKKVLDEFVHRLQGEYATQILGIFLYGSQARGEQEESSDVDILVISNTKDWHFKHEVSNIASDIGLEYDLVLDTHVISKDVWGEMQKSNFSYYRNVTTDGISLPI